MNHHWTIQNFKSKRKGDSEQVFFVQKEGTEIDAAQATKESESQSTVLTDIIEDGMRDAGSVASTVNIGNKKGKKFCYPEGVISVNNETSKEKFDPWPNSEEVINN